MKKKEEKEMKEKYKNLTAKTKTQDMAKIRGGCLKMSVDVWGCLRTSENIQLYLLWSNDINSYLKISEEICGNLRLA